MSEDLTLISHHLCPYVQRAVISLSEKNVPFKRIDIDLGNKPSWFAAISPLGRTPVLRVGKASIFESAVILEYLEDTQSPPLHPPDPLVRAQHRGWIEFGSAILSDIAGFYLAMDIDAFTLKICALNEKFTLLKGHLNQGPYFGGERFSLVDAAYGPIFRYVDTFDKIGKFGILNEENKISDWRAALSARPSIRSAVAEDYGSRLWQFLRDRKSYLSGLMNEHTFS